jgi:uncharacterized cupin superfamily protein
MAGGPYTSSSATERWEPFELADGRVVGEAHLMRADEDGGYYAGFWRVPAGDLPAPFDYAMELNETIHVVEGALTIEVEGGPSLDLGPGDIASFEKGTKTRWTLREVPFREVFVLS